MESKELLFPTGGKAEPSHVQSVQRALLLLELLSKERREMSLTDIARALQWPKSTVHGLLATLRDFHYVDQSPDSGKYRLGIRLFELGTQVADSWNIREVARPYMLHLSDTLHEMVQMGKEDKGDVLYVEKVDSAQMMRIVSEVGARLPMHCTGLGKMLLSHMPFSKVKWIVSQKGLEARTGKTITNLPALKKELEAIQQQGYAMDDCEIMDSLRCVAAPIFNRYGEVEFAISVSGFANGMWGEHLEKAIAEVKLAAQAISAKMGYRTE
ncbi:MAG: IclR family transcriptional regulator [Oscillospiraceae bacterium]